ncbi:hypothetical protein PG989_009566 [Apiospora arundinis]
MRDADRRQTKHTASNNQYAIARPTICDDSNSDFADDEYSSDDEFLILSSDSEQCEPEKRQTKQLVDEGHSVSSCSYGSTELLIMEDYFDTILSPSYQTFHDLAPEVPKCEADGPSAIRPNLTQPTSSPMGKVVNPTTSQDTSAVDEHTSPARENGTIREGTAVEQQANEDADEDDSSDGWVLASSGFDDSWASEIEAVEEEHAARGEEAAETARMNHQPRSALRSSQRPSRNRDRKYRQVRFHLRPTILGEEPQYRRIIFPHQRC